MSSANPQSLLLQRLETEIGELARTDSTAPFELAQRLLELKEALPGEFTAKLDEIDAAAKAAGAKGLSRRRAFYLLSVVEALPLDRWHDRLRRVGWIKAAAIAAQIKKFGSDTDVDRLFDLAERNTVANLKRVFADEDAVAGMRCIQLRLTRDQYRWFADALLRHGATRARGRGLHGMEEALLSALGRA
jgi:hypothetical protein